MPFRITTYTTLPHTFTLTFLPRQSSQTHRANLFYLEQQQSYVFALRGVGAPSNILIAGIFFTKYIGNKFTEVYPNNLKDYKSVTSILTVKF